MTTTNTLTRWQGITARVSPHPHRLLWLTSLALGLCAGAASLRGSAQPPAQLQLSAEPAGPQLGLEKLCQRGDAIACNDLGISRLHGDGLPRDSTLAVQAFERSCARGCPDGCNNLGALYERGVGVANSLERAVDLYQRACAGGAALGCSNLGALYARGRGVPRDVREAERLFHEACEYGSAMGCTNLLELDRR